MKSHVSIGYQKAAKVLVQHPATRAVLQNIPVLGFRIAQ